jgi:hypothetical protein
MPFLTSGPSVCSRPVSERRAPIFIGGATIAVGGGVVAGELEPPLPVHRTGDTLSDQERVVPDVMDYDASEFIYPEYLATLNRARIIALPAALRVEGCPVKYDLFTRNE